MLIVALVLAVIGLAALVTAVVTSNELIAWGCIAASVSGVVLLIGQEDGLSAAVVVDAIEDQRQVVIKGLQESYGRVPGIAAATILGDGQIALILDPIDLIAQASGLTKISSAVSGPKSLSGSSSHGDFI